MNIPLALLVLAGFYSLFWLLDRGLRFVRNAHKKMVANRISPADAHARAQLNNALAPIAKAMGGGLVKSVTKIHDPVANQPTSLEKYPTPYIKPKGWA